MPQPQGRRSACGRGSRVRRARHRARCAHGHLERGFDSPGNVPDIDSMKLGHRAASATASACASARLCARLSGSPEHDHAAQLGTASLSSSSAFPSSSRQIVDIPVMFPPGRARLGTSPAPTGSPTRPTTHRDGRGRLLGRHGGRRTHRDDHVNLEANQLRGELRQTLESTLGVAVLEHEVPALDYPSSRMPLAQERRRSADTPEPVRARKATRSGRPSPPAAPRRRAARRGGRRPRCR